MSVLPMAALWATSSQQCRLHRRISPDQAAGHTRMGWKWAAKMDLEASSTQAREDAKQRQTVATTYRL